MREIKFRAWNKEKSEMNYLGHMNFMHEGYVVCFMEEEGYVDDSPDPGVDEKMVLMQYTGLKDRNGLEIYEGDILKRIYFTPVGEKTEDLDDDSIGEVVFKSGSFSLKPLRIYYNIVPLTQLSHEVIGEYVPNYGNKREKTDECSVEVIGNIYENPDLIK